MPPKSLDEHITTDPTIAGGQPCIAGHAIRVQDIFVWHERMGRTAAAIAAQHGLTLGDVHAALAYCFDHQAEIERAIAEGEDVADMFCQTKPPRRAGPSSGANPPP